MQSASTTAFFRPPPLDAGGVARRVGVSALAWFMVLLLTASPAPAEEARVLKVRDGDSFLAEVGGVRTDVRMIGIDCPEFDQEWGDRAKAAAEAFLLGGPVELEFDVQRRDRYNRLLAYVSRHGRMLNLELVRQGVCLESFFKPNRRHRRELRRAQSEAESEARGFWAEGGLSETPRAHRAKRRQAKTGGESY